MAVNYSGGETSSEDECDYSETQTLDLSYSGLDGETLHRVVGQRLDTGSGERWVSRSPRRPRRQGPL